MSTIGLNDKQIFVRNLPFDATDEDLTSLFEDIGPIKNASVALSNDGSKKGFGFVKFALAEDAQTALSKLQGTEVRGRKLILELGFKTERGKGKGKGRDTDTSRVTSVDAVEKEDEEANEEADPLLVQSIEAIAHSDDGNDEKNKTQTAVVNAQQTQPMQKRTQQSEEPTDGTSIKRSRQILVFGVPTDLNKKNFRTLATKGFPKAEVELLKEDHELSPELHIIAPSGRIMLITAHSRQEAEKLVKMLNNATLHSLLMAHVQSKQSSKGKKQKQKKNKKNSSNSPDATATVGLNEETDAFFTSSNSRDRKEKFFARTVADLTTVDLRKRKCRLIIRNLSFQATEQNILDRMSKFGPVVSVELPKKPSNIHAEKAEVDDGGKKKPLHPAAVKRRQLKLSAHRVASQSESNSGEEGEGEGEGEAGDVPVNVGLERSMGFGFVTFLCEKDAQFVVNSEGLKICNREIAVDYCMSKESYEKYGKHQQQEQPEEMEVEDKGQQQQMQMDVKASMETLAAEAGDHLSIDDDEEEDNMTNDNDSGDNDNDTSDSDKDGEEEGQEEEEEDDDDDKVVDADDDTAASDHDDDHDDDDDDEEEEEEVEEDAEKGTKKPRLQSDDVKEGCTVFLRGLPYDAESSDLKKALGMFGRITVAVIVKDRETEMSKGTAFVKFAYPASAERCLAQAAMQDGAGAEGTQRAERSISSSGGGILVKDRICRVDLAVDRDAAKNIKQTAEARRGKDRRNLYLANEGLLISGAASSADQQSNNNSSKSTTTITAVLHMSDMDKEKRQRAQTEKRKKLQNPLFFVSGNRLSLRNLSKTITDKQLRTLCVDATRRGLQKALVTRSDMELYRIAQGSDQLLLLQQQQQQQTPKKQKSETNSKKKANESDLDKIPFFSAKHAIRSAKVMLDLQRIRGGAPQSRGYAFVEFAHHAHALACLRELNNADPLISSMSSNKTIDEGSGDDAAATAAAAPTTTTTAVANMKKNKSQKEVSGKEADVGDDNDETTTRSAIKPPASSIDKQQQIHAAAVGSKLIVEFSLENIQKVKVLRGREERAQKRKLEETVSKGSGSGSSTPAAAGAAATKTSKSAGKNIAPIAAADDDDEEDDDGNDDSSRPAAKKKRQQVSAAVRYNIHNGGIPGAHTLNEVTTATTTTTTNSTTADNSTTSGSSANTPGSESKNTKLANKQQERQRLKRKRPRNEKAPLASSVAPQVSAPSNASADLNLPAVATGDTADDGDDKAQGKRAKPSIPHRGSSSNQRPPASTIHKHTKKAKSSPKSTVKTSPTTTASKNGKTPTDGAGGTSGSSWGGHKRLRALKRKNQQQAKSK